MPQVADLSPGCASGVDRGYARAKTEEAWPIGRYDAGWWPQAVVVVKTLLHDSLTQRIISHGHQLPRIPFRVEPKGYGFSGASDSENA